MCERWVVHVCLGDSGVEGHAVVHVAHEEGVVGHQRGVEVLVSRSHGPEDLHRRHVTCEALGDALVGREMTRDESQRRLVHEEGSAETALIGEDMKSTSVFATQIQASYE